MAAKLFIQDALSAIRQRGVNAGKGSANVYVQGTRQLVGLVSHKFASGQLAKFRCCFYGQITYQVRISRYTNWINTVMSGK